ncbi:MAG TPA: tetratricopeptide repeat protein [Luteimonas sp.]|nr:tetratricopeptide repeat protein [Luteimonas sp.]
MTDVAGTGGRSDKAVRVGASRVKLGRLIKSGGAGSVYLLPQRPQSVAKLYHDHLHPDAYSRKVEAMLALSPDLPVREEHGERYVQIAWPTELVHDDRGRFLGFLMPLLDIAATSELETVLQERQAAAQGLPTGLGAKMTLAANLASVIAALHRRQHYVVDLKPVNLRFYRESLYIALLDCDGFSIQGRGERFRASQFTPDYLAPEFQRGGVASEGERTQDLFALAVVVFRLLNFGIHPFTGKPGSQRVPTDIPGRIRDDCYAYGRRPNPAMAPSPVSGHALMPGELRDLFDRAFGGRDRPDADEWAKLLTRYARRDGGQLVGCRRNPAHQHFTGMACAACARAELLERSRRQARAQPRQTRARRVYTPAPGRAHATTTGPRRGAPQSGPSAGGTSGCLTAIVIVVLGCILMSRSCGNDPVPADPIRPHATISRPVVVEQRAEPDPLPPIVPVTTRPDPARMEHATLGVLEAMGAGDASAYAHAMAELTAAAQAYPRAQPASLQAYFAGIGQRNESTRERLETRDDDLRAIVEADPYAAFAVIELGVRLLLRGRPAEARAMFTQAAATDPRNPKAWYGLGLSYLEEDQARAAAGIAVAQLGFANGDEADATAGIFDLALQNGSDTRQRLASAKARAGELAATLRDVPVRNEAARTR